MLAFNNIGLFLAVANAEAFGDTVSMSFSKLRKLSANCSNANLETAMTLSQNASDQLIAIILYTSGSTGVPKGNFYALYMYPLLCR